MAGPYSIDIINGAGSSAILNGNYDVTCVVDGYSDVTIDPASILVQEGTDSYSFTIAATGTFTIHVSEDGLAGGTAVVGATFKRCDADGNEYGDDKTSDADGNAVFDAVPFSATGITVYYKQTASDGKHEFDAELKSVSMTAETLLEEIANAAPTNRTIDFTDANYKGLPIEAGEITLTEA